MSKKLVLLVVLMAASLILTACGGSGSSTGGASTTINATMTDFKFDPDVWTVPAGKEITIKLTNTGAVEHDWVLMAKPVTPPAAADSPDQVFIADVEAGENVTVKFTAPSAPGEYQVICAVPGHLEAGMAGKLIVVQQ